MRIKTSLGFLALAMTLAVPAQGQTAADSAAIIAASLDYLEGWHEGRPDRIDRAMHDDLVKRIVRDGEPHLMTKQQLVAMTQRRGRQADVDMSDKVFLLDIFNNMATTRIDSPTFVDYLQLSKMDDGRWVIVNVLWTMR